MKRFIRSFLAAPFFLLAAVSSYSQTITPEMSTEEKAEILTNRQDAEISFEGAQRDEMHVLNLKYLEEMEEIRSRGRSFSTLRSLRDMSKRKDKEVKQILDKEQYDKYLDQKEEMKSEMRAQMKEKDS